MVNMDEELVLTNACATHVRIPRDGVIASWSTGTCLQKNTDGFPYSLSAKTLIYDKQTKTKKLLETYIKEGLQTTKSIWKYKEFQPCSLPKVLVFEELNSTYQFDCKGMDRDFVLATIQACRKTPVRLFGLGGQAQRKRAAHLA